MVRWLLKLPFRLLKILVALVVLTVVVLVGASVYFIGANRTSETTVYSYAAATNADYDTGISGAIYVPADAYNAYQMWRDYNAMEMERDLGYAQSANLNALRVFTSYEYWQEDPEGFFEDFEDMVTRAGAHGIRILPVLFEDCGVDNTVANRTADTAETGFCVCSPERAIQKNKDRWSEVDPYVNAFCARYAGDTRLLAIEIMNEPHILSGNIGFAKHVLELARSFAGSVPLTMGQLTIFHNLLFAGLLDIYQYHDNFPNSTGRLEAEMKLADIFHYAAGRPFWLTEWQRVRTSGGGWGATDIPEADKSPDYASLAPSVRDAGACSFFWCLMVKDAYLPTQRSNGTFNGLFYPDGTVYSETDLAAIRSIGAGTS